MFDMCQIVFIPFSIKTIQPALRPQEIHPFWCLRHHLPSRGSTVLRTYHLYLITINNNLRISVY